MRPVLNKGDIVYIKKARPEQLKKDAIITYRQSETDVIVTHRISRIDSDKQLIYTIGDANFGEDYTPISYHDVIGIYSGYKVTIFELFY